MGVFKREEEDKQKLYEGADVISSQNSLIGKTLFLKGELFSDEQVIIEGKIEGKIKTKNLVIVGKSGVVNADIVAREIIIKGRVNGNIKISHKIEIVPGGILNGNMVSKKVILAEGSIFKGNIDMELEEDKPTDKKPAETKVEAKTGEEQSKDKK